MSAAMPNTVPHWQNKPASSGSEASATELFNFSFTSQLVNLPLGSQLLPADAG